MNLTTRIEKLENQVKEPAIRTWADLLTHCNSEPLIVSDEMAQIINEAKQ